MLFVHYIREYTYIEKELVMTLALTSQSGAKSYLHQKRLIRFKKLVLTIVFRNDIRNDIRYDAYKLVKELEESITDDVSVPMFRMTNLSRQCRLLWRKANDFLENKSKGLPSAPMAIIFINEGRELYVENPFPVYDFSQVDNCNARSTFFPFYDITPVKSKVMQTLPVSSHCSYTSVWQEIPWDQEIICLGYKSQKAKDEYNGDRISFVVSSQYFNRKTMKSGIWAVSRDVSLADDRAYFYPLYFWYEGNKIKAKCRHYERIYQPDNFVEYLKIRK